MIGTASQHAHGAASRLCNELRSSWSTIAGLSDRLSETYTSLRTNAVGSEALTLLQQRYTSETKSLLIDPIDEYLRISPIRRSLEAIQECDREIDIKSARSRAHLDNRFQNLLHQAALDLCEPWQIYQNGGYENEWAAWQQRRLARGKEASVLLDQLWRWATDGSEISKLASIFHKSDRRELWWRRQRAVVHRLELEIAFCELGQVWLDAAQQFRDSIVSERREILSKAGQTLRWIQAGARANELHIEGLGLASPEERIRAWTHRMEVEAAKRLPDRVEILTPGSQPLWRSVPVRESFLTAFATYTQAPVSRIVEEYWSGTAEIVREVGRAPEILDYWRNTSSKRGESNALFSDARDNAEAMLIRQVETPDGAQDLDEKLARAFRTWSAEGTPAIEGSLYGWTILFQPRGRRLARAVLQLQQQKARAGAQSLGSFVSGRWDRTLESFGVRVPVRPTLPPVIRRTTLRDVMSLPASRRELPEIYHLLFRLSPVEDRRFLVGREQEFAGLEQALKDWDDGRFAACLVVGARGSGKTSLLNCAEADMFSGRKLIRGQFCERVLDAAQLDCFLRRTLRLPEGCDLEEALSTERRIVMIEESERTYLRKVGGFRAIHYLIELIHRTASSTFWIIVLNDKSGRVLDAGTQFSRVFSHRINAMSVTPDDLEKAILERHRLSGWRLEFAAPPAGDPRVGRVKKWLGMQDSPQKLFFQSLFQQSEGIFRSAFELWLSSIERIEGGIVKIRQPLTPAFGKFRSELSQSDQFTLQAIQEHGSLAPEELAEVLCELREKSRSRCDRLWALGLIEPDPEHPGLRVRPEAQRFVNDLLRRANLN